MKDVSKAQLFDGNGQSYQARVARGCGVEYILKRLHLADNNFLARSTDPYSMIAHVRSGSARWRWAPEAYGVLDATREMLTIKSDRRASGEGLRWRDIPEPRIPESSNVLIREVQSLSLNDEVRSARGDQIELREIDEDVFRAAEELGIDPSRHKPAEAGFD